MQWTCNSLQTHSRTRSHMHTHTHACAHTHKNTPFHYMHVTCSPKDCAKRALAHKYAVDQVQSFSHRRLLSLFQSILSTTSVYSWYPHVTTRGWSVCSCLQDKMSAPPPPTDCIPSPITPSWVQLSQQVPGYVSQVLASFNWNLRSDSSKVCDMSHKPSFLSVEIKVWLGANLVFAPWTVILIQTMKHRLFYHYRSTIQECSHLLKGPPTACWQTQTTVLRFNCDSHSVTMAELPTTQGTDHS